MCWNGHGRVSPWSFDSGIMIDQSGSGVPIDCPEDMGKPIQLAEANGLELTTIEAIDCQVIQFLGIKKNWWFGAK